MIYFAKLVAMNLAVSRVAFLQAASIKFIKEVLCRLNCFIES